MNRNYQAFNEMNNWAQHHRQQQALQTHITDQMNRSAQQAQQQAQASLNRQLQRDREYQTQQLARSREYRLRRQQLGQRRAQSPRPNTNQQPDYDRSQAPAQPSNGGRVVVACILLLIIACACFISWILLH